MGSLKDEQGRMWTDHGQDIVNKAARMVNEHFKQTFDRNVTEEELRKMFEVVLKRQPTMEEVLE
jgi:hypothetical protein